MQLPQTSGLPKSIPQPLLTEVAHQVSTVRSQPRKWYEPTDTRTDDIVTAIVQYHEFCEQHLTDEEWASPEAMSAAQRRTLLVWACELDNRLEGGIRESEFSEAELEFFVRAGLVRREDIRE